MNFNDTHTFASQPYRTWKLTAPPWNGFMLKHDHENMPYFPAKNYLISLSAWYGSQFLNCTYGMVPRQNWTKLRGLTLPLSDFLRLLCRRILPDRSRTLDTWWKTAVKALSIEPQFSQQFFVGRSTEPMTPELWYKFGNLFTVWVLRKMSPKFGSTTISSLAASVLIMEPNARVLHDLKCLMTLLQNFSTVATL